MNRRWFLQSLAPLFALPFFGKKSAINVEVPLGKWILIAENDSCRAWLMKTESVNNMPMWLGRFSYARYKINLKLGVQYQEIHKEGVILTFAAARMMLIKNNPYAFRRKEDYTPGPWEEGSVLAKNYGWNPNWIDRYKC